MQLQADPNEWLILDSVDSTNSFLLQSTLPPGTVVFAREQTGGRGRRGRSWSAVPGDSLIFSGLLEFRMQLVGERMRFLPLLAGLAVLRASRRALLNKSGESDESDASSTNDAVQLAVKWPNDVYLTRDGTTGKLGGVLVESAIAGDAFRLVIGVGLNYRGEAPGVDAALIPPAVLFPGPHRRSPIESFGPLLIEEINRELPALLVEGPPSFLEALRAANYLRDRYVLRGTTRYRVLDFTEGGELLLADAESGDILRTDDASEDIRIVD